MQFSHTIQLFETDPQLVDNFFEAIIALDHNLAIAFWNFGARMTFGYSRDEAIGKNFETLISPNQFDIKITSIINELDDNVEWRGEIIHKKKDNSLIFCVVSITKVKHRNGAFEYLIISRDVSERKELENLQRLNDVLEEQLNNKSVELTAFFERIYDGFFSIDRDWKFTHINKKAASLFNRDANSLIGNIVWNEFPMLRNTTFSRVYVDAMEKRQYLHFEEYYDQLDKWFQIDIYPTEDGLAVFFRDISEEKEAERKIRESEELYRQIVETVQEGIWMLEPDYHTTFVNSSLAKMLGYKREELIGRNFFDFVNRETRLALLKRFEDTQKTEAGILDITLTTKDEIERWVMLNSSPLYKNNQYAGLLITVMDISERKKNEQELKDSHQQLRHLASRLQHIREEERSSLAREIHDELGQQLTALKMDLYWIYKHLPDSEPQLKTRTEEILKLVNETLPKVEKKAIELHPSLLHDLGLLAALEWQNKQFLSRHEASIDFTTQGSDTALPKETAVALYRIYQEALTNVSRHANATKITTTFVQTDSRIELTICDNGVGFNKSGIDKKKSLGLLSMKERCIMIGGKCEIKSAPQRGTVVSVTVPLKQAEE